MEYLMISSVMANIEEAHCQHQVRLEKNLKNSELKTFFYDETSKLESV